jgi:hypothetical protein
VALLRGGRSALLIFRSSRESAVRRRGCRPPVSRLRSPCSCRRPRASRAVPSTG